MISHCIDFQSNLHVFFMVLHDSPFQFGILVRYKSVWRKVRVIGIVLCHVIAALSYGEPTKEKKGFIKLNAYRKSTQVMWVKDVELLHLEPGKTRWEPPSYRCIARCLELSLAWFAYKRDNEWIPLPTEQDLEHKTWRRSVKEDQSATFPIVDSSAFPSPASIWRSPSWYTPIRSNQPPIDSPVDTLARTARSPWLWPDDYKKIENDYDEL